MKQVPLLVLLAFSLFLNAQVDLKDISKKCEGFDPTRFSDGTNHINAKDEEGNTLLMTVIIHCPEIAEELIKVGAELDRANNQGETALIIAAKNREYDLIRILVDSGADFNALNNEGQSVLTILRLQYLSNPSVVGEMYKFLKDKGAFEFSYLDYIETDSSETSILKRKELSLLKEKYDTYQKSINSFKRKECFVDGLYGHVPGYESSYESYAAFYDRNNQLVFFKHSSNQDFESSESRYNNHIEEQYYFEDGNLYLYRHKRNHSYRAAIDISENIYEQKVYIKNGKEIMATSRNFSDLYKKPPLELNGLSAIQNIKAIQSTYFTVDAIIKRFKSKYQAAKPFLE